MPVPREIHLGPISLQQRADGFHFAKTDILHAMTSKPGQNPAALQGERLGDEFRD